MNKKLILFDMDGTLVQSGNLRNHLSVTYAIKSIFNIDVSIDDINHHGKVDAAIFIELLELHGISNQIALQHLKQLFDARFEYFVNNTNKQYDDIVLPGVFQLLENLKDIAILGILTGNEEKVARHRLDLTDLKNFFSVGAFGNEARMRNDLPPKAIYRALELLKDKNISLKTLIVGDTIHDINCAKANQLPVIAVATGIYSESELMKFGADYVFTNLTFISEILQIILNL